MEGRLKQARQASKLTQKAAAELLQISLRSYVTYENDPDKEETLKYKYMLEQLEKLSILDEDHGVLELEDIIDISGEIFEKYPIDYCYLFGSYASGEAGETSDVDLFVSTELTGLKYFGLIEELREKLHKRIDLVTLQQSADNMDLVDEVLREGIRIFRRS
ncbi:MAG: nucleotidyltransferase domain-containing protein [Saccharofermentanales bacterium]|jgi:predicted nucleotidyltransferase